MIERVLMYILLLALVLLAVVAWVAVVQPVWGADPPQPGPLADSARLEAHVRKLSIELSPRDCLHPENLDRAADWLREEFEMTGASVEEQIYEAGGHNYSNVIARLGPASGERIVVGAHYDAAGSLPGADDNASGVAGLLEVARLLAPKPLAIGVELVAYTLEEDPHFGEATMGSSVHARSLRAQGVDVRAMLALEMLGYFSDQPHSQRFPMAVLGLLYPSTGNNIVVVSRLADFALVRRVKRAMRGAGTLPVISMTAPTAVTGVDFSDHRSYWREGYPAAMITDTAFYRNANYHTAGDTADTLDYRRMAQVVDGVRSAIEALASR